MILVLLRFYHFEAHQETAIKKRDAVFRWPRGQCIAIQGSMEGYGYICITSGSQSSLGGLSSGGGRRYARKD